MWYAARHYTAKQRWHGPPFWRYVPAYLLVCRSLLNVALPVLNPVCRQDARLTALDALVATEQVFPDWLQQLRYLCTQQVTSCKRLQRVHNCTEAKLCYRSSETTVNKLEDPDVVLHDIQNLVAKRQTKYNGELKKELRALEKRFSWPPHSSEFADCVANRELRLPAPLTSVLLDELEPNESSTDVCMVSAKSLDVQDNAPVDQHMQQELQSRQEVQLIAITREMPTETAHLQYSCIAGNPLPLLTWAKILDGHKTKYVAHLAILIDRACNTSLYEDLQKLQRPSSKDVAARLDVAVTANLAYAAATSVSLRLNICQPEDGRRAKV